MSKVLIAKIELRQDTLEVIAKKLKRREEIAEARDRMAFIAAKLQLIEVLKGYTPREHKPWF